MKLQATKRSTITPVSLFLLAMAFSTCNAQEFTRKGQTEIFGMFQTMSSETISMFDINWGTRFDFKADETFIYGFGIGHNLTDHWNVNTDFLYGSQDWSLDMWWFVSGPTSTDIFLWDINVDYNILKGRLTPYVTAGIGLFNFIDDYDFEETDFSYNLGAGARWDISDKFLLKAIYRFTWTDIEDTDDTAQFGGASISFGIKF